MYSFQIVLLQQMKYLLYIFFLLLFNFNFHIDLFKTILNATQPNDEFMEGLVNV